MELRRELRRVGRDALRLLGQDGVLEDFGEPGDGPRQGALGLAGEQPRNVGRGGEPLLAGLAQDRRDPGVGVLDVVDRVLG